jgi:pimeloyl-ACP methyl ester carboxylesterase
MNLSRLQSHSNPARSYAEAEQRFTALSALDGSDIGVVSRSALFTHGAPVERVVVWFHGYTNSPAQFNRLGRTYFEKGCNVVIPRFPHHGIADRLTSDTAHLTAEELAHTADEAVDIARGLGKQVFIGGLSMGGVVTGWLAQQRSDIELALLIAPAFGVYPVAAPLTRLFTEAILFLPNFFRWWNPLTKGAVLPPLHEYPRYASHGLGQMLRLSQVVQVMARERKPAAQRISVITSACDRSINQPVLDQVIAAWRARGMQVQTHEFGADLALDHDMIDPDQPKQKVAVSYPKILEMMG